MGIDFSVVQDAALDAFGREIEYTPLGGSPVLMTVIYRSAHRRIDVESGAPIHSNQPQADVQVSRIPGGVAKRGDRILVDGVTFEAVGIEIDGEGMAELSLMKK